MRACVLVQLQTTRLPIADAEPFDLAELVPEDVADGGLKVAVLAGQAVGAAERFNEQDSGRKSFAELMLSDVVVNPYISEAKQYLQLGLWQKIVRTGQQALKRAKGEATTTELAFQDVFMGKLTEHFASDIDRLRQVDDADQEPFDEHVMEVVVDALQSQADMFDDKEKAALVSFAEVGELS